MQYPATLDPNSSLVDYFPWKVMVRDGTLPSELSESMTESKNRSYPLEVNGRFYNPFNTFNLSEHATFRRLMSMAYEAMTQDKSNIPGKEILDETLPIQIPNMESLHSPPISDSMQITWIGHATVLLQLQAKSIIFDPVFSQRCSPSQFFGPKRYRPVPLTIEELPPIDVCCISHDHYDHMDSSSIRQINQLNPNAKWFVPLRCNDVLERNGVAPDNIYELSWWDEFTIDDQVFGDITFALTPAQHWGRRGTFDMWKRLWGSWTVIGDTGYCPAFKEIGEAYGPFDVAAIPIGAYAPRWFMSPQHVDPEEAVKIHRDLRARKSFGIHWGTFKLTIEPYLEPRESLAEHVRKAGLPADAFTTMKHGETCVYYPAQRSSSPQAYVVI